MSRINMNSLELFTELVAWELLGREDLDPKVLLRQIPLSDLSVVFKNCEKAEETKNFMCVDMVKAEMKYRLGKLKGDWNYRRDGSHVVLIFDLRENMHLVEIDKFLLSAVEANG